MLVPPLPADHLPPGVTAVEASGSAAPSNVEMTALATAIVGLPHEVPLPGPLPPAPVEPLPPLPPVPTVVTAGPLVVDPADPLVALVDAAPPAPVVPVVPVAAALVAAVLVVPVPAVGVDDPLDELDDGVPLVPAFEPPVVDGRFPVDVSSEEQAAMTRARMLGARA